ncbi:hypothetical protein [Sphaerisporangium fuscum]|uniref:hypothetical protein n=1 Tax=Sphaerisporangium fuscum TaxID=2835868 RepID=UPI001BDCF642|nr:hypothetical protein [Sphaerisporangium fuscum]
MELVTRPERGQDRPKLRLTVAGMKTGGTSVIYRPDLAAGSVKELLVFLGDELAPRGTNLDASYRDRPF